MLSPKSYFDDIWARCNEIRGLYVYLNQQLTAALSPDELLRAEWVARVSALDLYVHELVAQNLVAIFEGRRPECPGYLRFSCTNATLMRIKNATSAADSSAAFTLEVRDKLNRITYQFPEDIADGIRLISTCELWNDVALQRGATPKTKSQIAKGLKTDLSLIVERRNKIAHEGDLEPTTPRTPWPINRTDVDYVADLIEGIVRDIDLVV